MAQSPRVSKLAAVVMTAALAFSMVSLILKIVNEQSTERILFQLLTTSVTAAAACLLWVAYARDPSGGTNKTNRQ